MTQVKYEGKPLQIAYPKEKEMIKIITFPWMGSKYTELIKESLENLGMNIMLPPKTSDKTIKYMLE